MTIEDSLRIAKVFWGADLDFVTTRDCREIPAFTVLQSIHNGKAFLCSGLPTVEYTELEFKTSKKLVFSVKPTRVFGEFEILSSCDDDDKSFSDKYAIVLGETRDILEELGELE
jgi:hypothetical protein